jgi:hypothetical protein
MIIQEIYSLSLRNLADAFFASNLRSRAAFSWLQLLYNELLKHILLSQKFQAHREQCKSG